jgi:NAD(P)-dependent dehydrogenase (short-subunit alcohol dehydrogenase family)
MTPSDFRLDGELAIITGGGTGLGLGIAECFVAAGARVVLVGRRKAVLAEACKSLGKSAFCRAVDITDFDRTGQVVREIEASIGAPTILVNNAGVHLKKPAIETSPDEFRSVLETHVIAAHNLSRLVLPGMITRRHGSLLFTASMTSLMGIPEVIAYAAAKSAYVGMIRTLATEVSPHGVRVNGIAPGWIDTPMWRQVLEQDPDRADRVLTRTPMGRFGEPADVGPAAVFLCSPAAKFITGVLLPVDGGVSIGF